METTTRQTSVHLVPAVTLHGEASAQVFLCRLCNCVSSSPAEGLSFTTIYNTVGFKEAEAKVFLSSPITARILEVERFTSAQDRFNVTTQRSVNKVHFLSDQMLPLTAVSLGNVEVKAAGPLSLGS